MITILILVITPAALSSSAALPAADSGPHEALHTLYADHHGWLQRWLRGKLRNAHEAADLAQDTFMRVLAARNAAEIREPRDYLATLAKRVLIDHVRRQALERAYLDALAQAPEPCANSPETRALIIETLCEIDAMLDGMGARPRQAFLLSQLEGLAYADIAARLGVSVSSVKKYMATAIEHCLVFRLCV